MSGPVTGDDGRRYESHEEEARTLRLEATAPDMLAALKVLVPLLRSLLRESVQLVDSINELARAHGYDAQSALIDRTGIERDLVQFDAIIAKAEGAE